MAPSTYFSKGCLVPGQELSLGDFVKQLAVRMADRGLVMVFKDEMPWHLLFYRLKKEGTAEGRPRFFDSLRFDWDGPYPKSQELSDFIQALHWTGSVGAVNPSYERITLQDDVTKLWSEFGRSLETPTVEFLEHAVEMATEEFPAEAA